MNLNKISKFIKKKRQDLGMTQEELAEKIFVTEKAVSRWETGRGTPDISLLIPLAKELNVEVSEILNGEEKKKNKNEVEQLILYNELVKVGKFNYKFKLVMLFYILSIITFLLYLRFEYDPGMEVNYFIRLIFLVVASFFIILGSKIYENNYVEKLEEKKRISRYSKGVVFLYYIIFIFNMVFFARFSYVNSYNLIPFKSIISLINHGSFYAIIINILGNLIIFMPLEYFIIELFKVNKLIINFILSFLIILSIEVFQFIFKVGVFDVDDLILCVLGMMIFYFEYKKNKKE